MSHLITVITISNVANVIIFVYLEFKYSHGDPHREKIFPIPIPWVWESPWVFPFPRQLCQYPNIIPPKVEIFLTSWKINCIRNDYINTA